MLPTASCRDGVHMNRIFISTSGNRLARAECGVDGNWAVEFLLEDKNVCCLTADPSNPNIVYAGTRGNGLLRSEDRGKTWQPAGLDGQIIKSIAICRADPQVIYVGTKPPAIFVTRDGRQTW